MLLCILICQPVIKESGNNQEANKPSWETSISEPSEEVDEPRRYFCFLCWVRSDGQNLINLILLHFSYRKESSFFFTFHIEKLPHFFDDSHCQQSSSVVAISEPICKLWTFKGVPLMRFATLSFSKHQI